MGDFVEGFTEIENDEICLRWSRFCDSSCTEMVSCVSVECLALYCQWYSIECLSKCAMMLLSIMCSWILQHI